MKNLSEKQVKEIKKISEKQVQKLIEQERFNFTHDFDTIEKLYDLTHEPYTSEWINFHFDLETVKQLSYGALTS